MWIYLLTLVVLVSEGIAQKPYIKQCSKSDPDLIPCLKGALHHLRPYLADGIEDIQMPSVEPFVMDHLQLQLTGGPQGYRIHLKNMEILGASNFTVEDLKLSENGKPFEASISIPRLNIRAKYQSTGVLIIIPASGNGDFAATFDGVVVKVRGLVSFDQRADIAGTFMHVDSLDLDLVVKKVRMSVSKIFNNSKLLNEATNLFLRENGNEILKAMLPQLQKKLANEFTKIGNSLLKHVPIEDFLRE